MTESTFLISLTFILSFIFALWLIPFIRKLHIKKNLTVVDMNKLSQPRVPSLGGIGVVFSFIISITITIAVKLIFNLNDINLELLLPGLLSIILMAFVGFIDDILMFPFRPIKPIFAILASIPMIVIAYNEESIINLPFGAEINIGFLYPLIIVPLIITFCSNAFNVMADFDGLSPGNGIVISGTLFICAIMSQKPTSALIFSSLMGVLIIFYYYNKFPAKLFIGNIGTLFIGSIFAIGAIIGNLKYALLIVMIPYLIHFILQERIVFDEKRLLARPRERGIPNPDGTIQSEYDKSYGLTHFLMRHVKNITEKKMVRYLIIIQIIFGIIAVIFHYQQLSWIY